MMARTKLVNGIRHPFTEAEEIAADQADKEFDDGKIKRAVMLAIRNLEQTVTQRRIREMTTTDGAKWMDDVEKLIAVERAKL